MDKIKTVGVIIKTMEYRENDRIATIYTDACGKISCLARGAKKNKSKLSSCTNDFVYGEFIFYKGRNMYYIEDSSVIEPFRQFSEDLIKIAYASYFCELIDISCVYEEENNGLFKEFITALYLLKLDIMNIETLSRIFEIKIIHLNGFVIEYLETSSNGLKNVIKYISNNPMKSLYKLKIEGIIKDELDIILNRIIKSNFIRTPKSLELLNYIK
ncbi:MAG: DNA repair protein RecO [Oscillospiraceae bacterium]|nr:DNA repair protein RecO [Oscillospiraceae bacterium]